MEKLITLGKKGDLHARRQALSYLMTGEAVTRLFETVAPRYGDRQGGYLRIVRTGFQKGDGAEKAFIELLGAEKVLDEKRQQARRSPREAPRRDAEGDGRAEPGRRRSREVSTSQIQIRGTPKRTHAGVRFLLVRVGSQKEGRRSRRSASRH